MATKQKFQPPVDGSPYDFVVRNMATGRPHHDGLPHTLPAWAWQRIAALTLERLALVKPAWAWHTVQELMNLELSWSTVAHTNPPAEIARWAEEVFRQLRAQKFVGQGRFKSSRVFEPSERHARLLATMALEKKPGERSEEEHAVVARARKRARRRHGGKPLELWIDAIDGPKRRPGRPRTR